MLWLHHSDSSKQSHSFWIAELYSPIIYIGYCINPGVFAMKNDEGEARGDYVLLRSWKISWIDLETMACAVLVMAAS